ncbi:hypothetical protein PGT21_030095 [Puccinia graminis f. sp. tritici]|uniref:Uncharacterized protein n=1 Tax=Puccinia graminis f. sp. tritici TaxID=56615 RepID=A0A5B0PZ33_PUCGR|nr:hypothetical protein PGT21_030095 [Puccinia graminis f. sp. tritici]
MVLLRIRWTLWLKECPSDAHTIKVGSAYYAIQLCVMAWSMDPKSGRWSKNRPSGLPCHAPIGGQRSNLGPEIRSMVEKSTIRIALPRPYRWSTVEIATRNPVDGQKIDHPDCPATPLSVVNGRNCDPKSGRWSKNRPSGLPCHAPIGGQRSKL